METTPIGLLQVKVVALPVLDRERAHKFYRDTLGLQAACEGDTVVGYMLGDAILMLKDDLNVRPNNTPNPRVTLAAEYAPDTEKALHARGVTIPDPVAIYDEYYVGSFLDSEGNKLWYCSPMTRLGT